MLGVVGILKNMLRSAFQLLSKSIMNIHAFEFRIPSKIYKKQSGVQKTSAEKYNRYFFLSREESQGKVESCWLFCRVMTFVFCLPHFASLISRKNKGVIQRKSMHQKVFKHCLKAYTSEQEYNENRVGTR